jgi:hypothetical protein
MKIKIMAVLAVGMASPVCHAHAQTNLAPTIRSNWIAAAGNFREVNGQLYNTERSVLWRSFNGKCLQVLTNGILIQTYTNEQTFETVTISRSVPDLMRGGVRTVTSPEKIPTDIKQVPEMKLILQNYPTNPKPTVFLSIPFRAFRVGTTDFNGEKLEVWDYGTPHFVMVVTTNYPHVFDLLQYHRDLAAKGDVFGLLRMGERYRDGEGVPKDLTKARDYLTRAAAAGSPTAADELKQMPAN